MKCSRTGKKRYPTNKAAQRCAKKRGLPSVAKRCLCGSWHLDAEISKQERKNKE